MFKYVMYTPFTDQYTTHIFNELNDKCKIHRFDMPYVSVECQDEADFTELMAYQSSDINATEITKEAFADMVQHSAQVKRMYDIANQQYVKECAAITSKYTQEEISTWNVQVAEAEAVKAGTAINTPFLNAIAADEEITLDAAADKILFLRDQHAAYTAGCLARKWTRLKELKSEVGL